MSHPQEPQRQPTSAETAKYAQTLRTTALVTAIVCPLLALLPPRKLDFLTAGLGLTTVYSTNYLVRDSTGRSIQQHITGYRPPVIVREGEETQMRVSDVSRQEKTAIAEQAEATRQQPEARWAKERNQEVQDALDVGKGFGDIIIDQVYEVWNWRKKDGDDE